MKNGPDSRFHVVERYTSIELKPEYMTIVGTFLEYHWLLPIQEKERLISEGKMDGAAFAELESARVIVLEEGEQKYFLSRDCRVDNMNMVIKVPAEPEE